jgi:hypothetical protein
MGVRTWRRLVAGILFSALAAPAGWAEAGQGRGLRHDRGESARLGPYERGFRDGVQQGEADARNRRAFNTSSARTDYGLGFSDGYRAGYDREHARAPLRRGGSGGPILAQRPSRGYQEPAFANGFESGYERGLADGRDGDRYDPVRHRDYREADEGYGRSYGSLDAYKNNYRAGFRQGYEQGYRDGARSRR